jgi:hypothetical protein
MTPPARGLAIFLCLAGLAACASPMDAGEAQRLASIRMARYCKTYCGSYRITGAQRLEGRWLVDFDSALRKFAVAVNDDGNTIVTTWDKR